MVEEFPSFSSLDPWQRRGLEECQAHRTVSILGAPGTGKTTLLAALVREITSKEHSGKSKENIVVLTQDRRASADLRSRLSRTLGGLGSNVAVRSLSACAFAILQSYAQAVGRQSPQLISGPEEDTLLGQILADPTLNITYPPYATLENRLLPGLREQIRDLLTRVQEHGFSPHQLEELGRTYKEPMWETGAQILQIYREMNESRDALQGSSNSPDRLDHAQLITAAASVLHTWEENVEAAPYSGSVVIAPPEYSWVIVDDLHNAPRSILFLLKEFARRGARIVCAGCPEAAVQGFRGGMPALPGIITRRESGLGAHVVTLAQHHRGGAGIAALSTRLSEAIRISGTVAKHRKALPGTGRDHVAAYSFVHGEEELSAITRFLRIQHLRYGVPYSQIALITRSRSTHGALRTFLVRHGIPVAPIETPRPLREYPAVTALLALIRRALGSWLLDEAHEGRESNTEGGEPNTDQPQYRRLTEDSDTEYSTVELLTSLLCSISPLELVRMRRILRTYELLRGGQRSEDELIEFALDHPEKAEELAPTGIEKLLAVSRLLEKINHAYHASGGQAEHVLWAAWEATGKAEAWQTEVLSGGSGAESADNGLDSILQLFRFAQRMADRDPSIHIRDLLASIASQELPEDSIAKVGALGDFLTLTTPSASQGREWDIVIVAGLNDGTWPNMQVRDSVTHTGKLSLIAEGRYVHGLSTVEEQHEAVVDVLEDELRQFHHAVTRARRVLILTCVGEVENAPSRFFSALNIREYSSPEDVECEEEISNLHGICIPQAVQESLCGRENPREYATDEGNGDLPVSSLSIPLWHVRSLYSNLDLAALVGQLRAGMRSEDTQIQEACKEGVTRLRKAGIWEARSEIWIDALSYPLYSPPPFSALSDNDQKIFVSPSKIEKLLQCPVRGMLSLAGGERTDSAESASIGTIIHAVAEAFPRGELPQMLAKFDELWARSMPSPDSSFFAQVSYRESRKKVEVLATYLASAFKEYPHEKIEVEKSLRVAFSPQITVTARLDHVRIRENGPYIVDFKTGKILPTKTDAADHVQLQVYQWAMEQAGEGRSTGAELVYPARVLAGNKPTIRQQARLSEESRQRVVERIAEAARVSTTREFPAQPEEDICRNCSFALVCPADPRGRILS